MKKQLTASLLMKRKLEKMKKQELIQLCTEFELNSFGSKAELVEKIKLLIKESETTKDEIKKKYDEEVKNAINTDIDHTEESSYDLQFIKSTETKITFINVLSEDNIDRNGVKIFLPPDSPVDFLTRWEKQVRCRSQPQSRRFCGAIMMSITEELGKQMEEGGVWTGGKGVLVCRVLRGSPAHGGGLAPGDCIIEVNGEQVLTLGDIYKELEGRGMLDCSVIREGKLKTGVCFEPLDN